MTIIKFYKTIFALFFVLILSLTPASDIPKINFLNIPNIDKLIHVFIYFILTSSILIDIKNNIKNPTKILILLAILFIAIFSGIIEIIQANYIFGRNGSIYDFFANCFGIFISIFAFRRFLNPHYS